jgi:hypothetical protein
MKTAVSVSTTILTFLENSGGNLFHKNDKQTSFGKSNPDDSESFSLAKNNSWSAIGENIFTSV